MDQAGVSQFLKQRTFGFLDLVFLLTGLLILLTLYIKLVDFLLLSKLPIICNANFLKLAKKN